MGKETKARHCCAKGVYQWPVNEPARSAMALFCEAIAPGIAWSATIARNQRSVTNKKPTKQRTKTMPKLNPNEAPKGHIAVQSTCDGCRGCAFDDSVNDECLLSIDYACSPEDRKNTCSVIFKRKQAKKKAKAKRKAREWMAWATIPSRRVNLNLAYWASIYETRNLAKMVARHTIPPRKVIRVKITEVFNAK